MSGRPRLGIGSPRGFTLVEVLIAMTLFGLVLTGLFSALYSTGRGWQSGEMRIGANEELRLVPGFLRQRIEQAVPLMLADDGGNHLLFRGEPDCMEFIAPLPAHTGGTGLHHLRLARSPGKASGSLVLHYEPVVQSHLVFDGGGEFGSDASELELIPDPGALAFEYFGTYEGEEERSWRRDWADAKQLPDLVRITLSKDGDPQISPLVVLVRARAHRSQSQYRLRRGDDG